MKHRKWLLWVAVSIILGMAGYAAWHHWMSPTRILVVNALEAQQADFVLNNDSRHIKVTCMEADEMHDIDDFDAIIVYARRIFLSDGQMAEIEQAARKGIPIFTKTLRSSDFVENRNLTDGQIATLQRYFNNDNRQNYRNGLRYLRHIATPHRWGDQQVDAPVEVPANMYYHREYGRYFKTADELTAYLQEKGMYHQEGPKVAFISGISFPMEGNREHVDTLISMLTQRGMNVYPLTAMGKKREKMLRSLKPDAVVYMAMGRIGNDTLVHWLNEHNIPLLAPYPLSCSHDDWMNESKPMASGSKNARIVIPEIDGGIAPFCIGTQNKDEKGFFKHTAEVERCQMFVDYACRYLSLRTKPNKDKRIAIGYFKRPGKDALLASGMEVIPSMYNFLLRLRQEGYDVSGLPGSLEAFARQVRTEGLVLGSYAKGAQQEYMRKGHPVWLSMSEYEKWAKEVLAPEKYTEVTARYGKAPGSLLAHGDSIAVACLRYGNVLLFPQPRPALGDDDFKLVHGVEVPPPHSYLAPYLYVQKGFGADALIHFGTHGNLEFTPGRDAGMRKQDWSSQLIGATPHFYYYTTGNIGEAVIAKRRSHAALLTYLTPPYAESSMRQKYATLLNDVHKAVETGGTNLALVTDIKRRIINERLHRSLSLDSIPTKPYTLEELERIDAHLEELSNEKMQGAFYTMGQPYTDEQLRQTILAMNADPLAYDMAQKDQQQGRITDKQARDYAFVAHHYLPKARRQVLSTYHSSEEASLILHSTKAEFDNMIRALNGGSIAPAPGGDPVQNPNVLPTGRNMFSINPDNTPDAQAWEDGKRLAEATLAQYKKQHGNYPQKVCYTFWAGEFIATGGATIAQALWMLGVEPVRDSQGRIGSLRLVPAKDLHRPRVDVVVQVSGQLRDIADSRLKLITEAIQLVSAEKEDSNFVREGTLAQEKELIDKGVSPQKARELSSLRVFGPVNNGYSTGMMNYIERSGQWTDTKELTSGYINNMCAAYGDEQNWGVCQKDLFKAALKQTDVVVQPRQSNTWGPISLDHVYEFTGGLSMTVKALTGKEPDALMADYRNRSNRRMQDVKEAVDVEMRTTLLNPAFVKERMKGDEGTAQMFGEMFRNIFGWSVTRPSSLDENVYHDLYRMYVADEQHLGVKDFMLQKNPAAFQSMTAVMLESARKGYWKPSDEQLSTTAQLHADITKEGGAACTDFVCNNQPLQHFVESRLSGEAGKEYKRQMAFAKGQHSENMVLEKVDGASGHIGSSPTMVIAAVVVVVVLLTGLMMLLRRKSKTEE